MSSGIRILFGVTALVGACFVLGPQTKKPKAISKPVVDNKNEFPFNQLYIYGHDGFSDRGPKPPPMPIYPQHKDSYTENVEWIKRGSPFQITPIRENAEISVDMLHNLSDKIIIQGQTLNPLMLVPAVKNSPDISNDKEESLVSPRISSLAASWKKMNDKIYSKFFDQALKNKN